MTSRLLTFVGKQPVGEYRWKADEVTAEKKPVMVWIGKKTIF